MSDKDVGVYFGSLSSKPNRNPVIIAIAVTFVLAIIIVIWAYFYGNAQVPWPEDRAPIFPEDAYQEASDFFKSDISFTYLGHNVIAGEVKALLTEDIPVNPVEILVDNLNQKYRGKAVVVNCTPGGLSDTTLDTEFSRLISAMNGDITEQEVALDQMSYWERGEALERLAEKKRSRRRLEDLHSFMKEGRLFFDIKFPNGKTVSEFGFVATDNLGEIRANSERRISLHAENAKPAFKAAFLKKIGVPEENIAKEKLSADAERLKNIYAEGRADFKAEIDLIKQQLSDQRARVREIFYKRWFAVLIQALVTYFMIWLLLIFFKIIRRKGLPHKSTFDVYFATNMTSIIMRWIALGIVVVGIVGLAVNLFQSIFAASISLSAAMEFRAIRNFLPSFFFSSGYAFAVISPVSQTLATVITAWGFVLCSEFICFLSNCYHVLFEKAYKTDRVKNLKTD
jgi:hypothetical protein